MNMLDNESFAFRPNKIHMPDPMIARSALLTFERARKLDLLIHLISNLSQSLVICGPNGIGKTTLLDELQKCDKDDLPILNIQASSNLSFENFENQLVRSLAIQNDSSIDHQSLTAILSELDKYNQKVVIIIDNAGQLVPGLINTLILYATENQCLRLVFSLTLDELHLKKSSDREIEDCHFIDIPPLTQKQCGIFLRHLSHQPGEILSYHDINDQLIERIYRETHGIPGEIIAEVSKGNNYNLMQYKWMGFVLAAAILVTLSVFLFLEESQVQQNEDNKVPQLIQEIEEIEARVPYSQPELPEITSNKVEDIAYENNLEMDEKNTTPVIKSESQIETASDGIEEPEFEDDLLEQNKQEEIVVIPEVKRVEVVEKNQAGKEANPEGEPQKANNILINKDKSKAVSKQPEKQVNKKKGIPKKDVVSAFDDSEWILKQPKNYYTMQLIVLSKRESVLGFFQDYPNLLGKLKFFQKRKQGNSQFVVIYGSFNNAAKAAKEMEALPPRFKKAWVRSFNGLHKMIKK